MTQATSKISDTTFDLIIIGAGINGAGIARDAAMRGLKVLLLDKGDLGGGTSSWSTRLIHGGLRYLEHGELLLVKESLRERETLLHIAPHIVRPLPILLPIYNGKKRGLKTIRAGMITYDLLSVRKSLPRHQMLSVPEVHRRVPGLNPEGLLGGALYYDAQAEYPERLVVENALSARQHGATVATYAKVRKLIVEGSVVRGVEGFDLIRGQIFKVRSRLVVNASGPWVDQVLASSEKKPQRLIGGTKGSHLIVAPFAGAPLDALYVEAEKDGRPFFIIPWDGKYLIGTTDIRFSGDLDDVEIHDDEIDYLLHEAKRVIPAYDLTRNSILYTYSGVRPLPYTESDKTDEVTRRHFIRESEQLKSLVSIVGGKLTTYRNLAQQTVDFVCRKLRKDAPKCRTAWAPLPGASSESPELLAERLKRVYGLSRLTSERLPRLYGKRASDVAKLTTDHKALLEVFDDETGAIGAEIAFSFKEEMGQTIGDCLLRRTMVGLNSTCGLNAVEAAARIAQTCFDWNDARAAQEVSAYRTYVERFIKFRQPTSK